MPSAPNASWSGTCCLWLGARPMADIQPMELLAVLQKIEERGALETADRAF